MAGEIVRGTSAPRRAARERRAEVGWSERDGSITTAFSSSARNGVRHFATT